MMQRPKNRTRLSAGAAGEEAAPGGCLRRRHIGNRLRARIFEVLEAFSPLGGGEETRPDFNEARDHTEDGDTIPGLAIAHAKAVFIEPGDDFGVRIVLRDEVHHEHQHLMLNGVGLEAAAIVGDAEPVGDVLIEYALGGGLGIGQLAPPLDGNHLPAGCGTLPDDVGAERFGDSVTHALKVGHSSPLDEDEFRLEWSNSMATDWMRLGAANAKKDKAIAEVAGGGALPELVQKCK